MRCHYEVLGVPRDVDSEDLKKTYRKLALQWHPDKNPDNIEEATVQFRLIQQAYDVLADPHERAFYDRYRESILRAGQGNSTEELLDLFEYFNCSCYSGYNDGEKGFYTVYREVFNKIAAEDEKFSGDSDESQNDDDVPEFGKSGCDYDEVVHRFYAYWSSYCSRSSYVWLNKYDLRDAPNRRVVRLMEKENKKIRDQARKKRNEEIRALVAFVRKRDKRVQQHRKFLEEKSAANARKAEDNRRRQLEERRKCLDNYQESDWTTVTQVEDILQDMEANIVKEFGDSQDEDSKSDDEENQDLYCIACDRTFKSPKAFQNHENSKRHKENFSLLKTAMEEEELQFNGSANSKDPVSDHLSQSEDEEDLLLVQTKKNKKTKRQKKNKKLTPQLDVENDDETVITPISSPKLDEPVIEEPVASSDTKENVEKRKKPKKTQKKTKQKPVLVEPTLTCVTCNTVFPSRNKLFQHLTKTGHSKLL